MLQCYLALNRLSNLIFIARDGLFPGRHLLGHSVYFITVICGSLDDVAELGTQVSVQGFMNLLASTRSCYGLDAGTNALNFGNTDLHKTNNE